MRGHPIIEGMIHSVRTPNGKRGVGIYTEIREGDLRNEEILICIPISDMELCHRLIEPIVKCGKSLPIRESGKILVCIVACVARRIRNFAVKDHCLLYDDGTADIAVRALALSGSGNGRWHCFVYYRGMRKHINARSIILSVATLTAHLTGLKSEGRTSRRYLLFQHIVMTGSLNNGSGTAATGTGADNIAVVGAGRIYRFCYIKNALVISEIYFR